MVDKLISFDLIKIGSICIKPLIAATSRGRRDVPNFPATRQFVQTPVQSNNNWNFKTPHYWTF